MATINQNWSKVAKTAGTLGENVGKSFTALGNSLNGLASGTSTIGRATAWTVSRPVAWLAHGVNIPMKMLNFAFSKAPVLSAGATILGGGMLAGKLMHNRAEANTQQDLMMQAAGAQMELAAAQQPVYRLAPGEHEALVESRLRNSEQGQGGFGARIRAAKEASTQVQQPTDAAAL